MYSKKNRLPIEKNKVLGQRTLSSPYFLIKYKENGKNFNRFGIIISNHSVKKSVRRHFWKRVFADALQSWPILQKDILVIASPKIEATDKKTVKNELNRILRFFSPKA